MKKRILELLNQNPRMCDKDLAIMLGLEEKEVTDSIAEMEKDGTIGGYRAIIDWEKASDVGFVTALIELKVTPRRSTGFDEIAQEILDFPEVESINLMSGAYDFAVYVTGKSIQDIAMFVARRLSTLDSVTSTATHFVLKRYKESGVLLTGGEVDERGMGTI